MKNAVHCKAEQRGKTGEKVIQWPQDRKSVAVTDLLQSMIHSRHVW